MTTRLQTRDFLFPFRVFEVYYSHHTTGPSGAIASESWYASLGGLTLDL
jgi:hypothetical protein